MKRLQKTALVGVAIAAAFFGVPAAYAHHSHAMFDEGKETTITGTIAGVSYTNPHVYLFVDVKGANGQSEKWSIEMSHIGNMMSRGVLRDTMKVGDEVVITMNPLRDGKRGGSYTRIVSINNVKNTGEGGAWAVAKAGQ